MYKRLISIVLAALLVMLLVSGCNTQTQTDQNNNNLKDIDLTPVDGGRLSFAIQRSESLNPLINSDRGTFQMLNLVYERLIEFDEGMNPHLVLAESFNTEDNGLTWTFNLRDGVKWHDGSDFTAQDVEFTLDVITKYKGNEEMQYKANLQNLVKGYKVIDELQIEVSFHQAIGVAPYYMDFPILSQNHYETIENIVKEELNNSPVGTGPYKLVENLKLQHNKLEAYEGYWGKQPYIKEIFVRVTPSFDAAASLFRSGDIDLMMTNHHDWDWSKYTSMRDVIPYEYSTSIYEFIGLNFNNSIFQDVNVRKAIIHGINRQEIINDNYLAHASMTESPISKKSIFYDGSIEKHDYNINKAKSLLQEAGWVEKENKWTKEEDGKEQSLSFTLVTNSDNQTRVATAEKIKNDLGKIGISVDVRLVKWDEISQVLTSKDFDAVLTGWNLSNIPDYSFAFHSNQIQKGSNFVSYINSEMDRILERSFRNTNDSTRTELMGEFQNIFVEDLPYISLFFKNSSIVVKNKIMGPIEPSQSNVFRNITNWYIPKDLQ